MHKMTSSKGYSWQHCCNSRRTVNNLMSVGKWYAHTVEYHRYKRIRQLFYVLIYKNLKAIVKWRRATYSTVGAEYYHTSNKLKIILLEGYRRSCLLWLPSRKGSEGRRWKDTFYWMYAFAPSEFWIMWLYYLPKNKNKNYCNIN